jgi:hypothetical protein
MVTAAIEPVWYLPEVAKRFNCSEPICAACCSRKPAACTLNCDAQRPGVLPPIAAVTVYIFNPQDLANPNVELHGPRPRRMQRFGWFGSDMHLP